MTDLPQIQTESNNLVTTVDNKKFQKSSSKLNNNFISRKKINLKTQFDANANNLDFPNNGSSSCYGSFFYGSADSNVKTGSEDLENKILHNPMELDCVFIDEPNDDESGSLDSLDKKNLAILKKKLEKCPKQKIEFECSVCNKKYGTAYKLNVHMRSHNETKPYACKICDKKFKVKTSLKTHMLIHSGDKPHKCDICYKEFRYKNVLNDHKLIHSGEKPHTCDICQKNFREKNQLVRHRRIHTGEKPYNCNFCNKTFVTKSDLNKHGRTHSKEKSNINFSQILNAKNHQCGPRKRGRPKKIL